MRIFCAFTLLLISTTAAMGADDELFSEVAMEAVFEKSIVEKETVTSRLVASPVRITSLGTLEASLQTAGYQPSRSGKLVSVKTRHAKLSLPFYLSIALEHNQLFIQLPVAKVADVKQLDANQLLKLLSVGDAENHFSFKFNRDDNTIQLQHRMSNRSIVPNDLKTTLDKMANFAAEHASTWSAFQVIKTPDAVTSDALLAKPEAVKPKTAKPVSQKPRLSLVGLWSATYSADEAFAIRIEKTAAFQLVHLKSGKSTVAKGTATKSGSQLTLTGDDGTKINGTFVQTTNNAFQLNIAGSDGKTALTLDFKKSRK